MNRISGRFTADHSTTDRFNTYVRHVAALAALLSLLGGAWPVGSAEAQTPVTNIENGNEELRLQLNSDGGLYVPGNYEGETASGDSIPATGAGTRMMWYPAKGAFRAGHIDNFFGDGAVEWDASNIGRTSAAFNYNTTASGPHSFAAGTKTTASSVGAVAMGFFTEAADTNAVAMGGFTTANAPRAMAIGNSTVASGAGAFSTGFGTDAGGVNSFATGGRTQANGSLSAAMGSITIAASPNSLSIGECNSSNTTTDGSLLVAGNGDRNGDSCSSRSDALRLDESGNMTIAGSLTQNSDRRLKTDVEDLEAVLGSLKNIDPVRYRFEDEQSHPTGEQLGVIAQEVQDEFPELVREGPGGMLSVAYPKLSAVLLKGMQQQQSQLEKQQAQIERKNEEMAKLRANQRQIQKRLAALEAEGRSVAAGWLSGAPLRAFGLLLVGGAVGAGLACLRKEQR